MRARQQTQWTVGLLLVALSLCGPGAVKASQVSNPCLGLRGIELPVDQPEELAAVQVRIIRCASYVQRVDYGNKGKVQCVRFAYLLMDKLREPGQRLFSGGDTAGAYFARLDSSGKTTKPQADGRPKDQSKPLYVWWNRNMAQGHLGVWIGGDLYIDSQSALLVVTHKLPIKDPTLAAWSISTPRAQKTLGRYIGRPWPRNSPSIPDGYSTARVNGGSCNKCQWTSTK